MLDGRSNILRFLHPFTDLPLVITALGGIVIFVSFDHFALKLIGICVTILSVIALFLLIAQRIKDDVPLQSETLTGGVNDIPVKVTTTADGVTRFTFDTDPGNALETDTDAPPTASADEPSGQSTQSLSPSVDTERQVPDENDIAFEDGDEGFRIVGTIPSSASGTSSAPATASPEPQTATAMDKPDPAVAPAPPENSVGHIRQPVDIRLEDILPNFDDIHAEPRKEFTLLLKQILKAIHNLIDARMVFYCWVSDERQQLRIEAFHSETALPIREGKIPIGDDLLSQIIQDSKPQIITDINESVEADLISYYTTPTGTRSLIAFPIEYRHSLIGLLVADSTRQKAFDVHTVQLLTQFACLITTLVHGYISKYDYYQAAQFLLHFQSFITQEPGLPDPDAITQTLEMLRNTTHPYLQYGIATWTAQGWSPVPSATTLSPDQLEHLLESIDPLFSLETPAPPPFVLSESSDGEEPWHFIAGLFFPGSDHRYHVVLLASEVPLVQQEQNFLQLFLHSFWHRVRGAVTPATLPPMIPDTVADRLWAEPMFRKLLQQELLRTKTLKHRSSLVLLRIDHWDTLRQRLGSSAVLQILETVFQIVFHHVPPYAPMGWLPQATIAIFLPQMPAGKARSLAELIREQIAKTPLQYHNTQFTVTVSAGIIETRSHRSVDTVLNKANAILERAAQKSNTVKIYA